MKGRAVIPLVLGLAIGAFAIKSFLSLLNKAKGASSGETVLVVTAATDIGPTAEIKPEMLETKDIPRDLKPDGAFEDLEVVIGRVTNTTIPAGIPIVPALLSPEGTLPGMSARVREGFRALAIHVDEVVGVGGWLKPGCRVDVIMVTCGRSKSEGSISKVILQDVEVLAVGDKLMTEGPQASVTRSVTVLVEPEQATLLTLASSKGKLRLAMRNGADRAVPSSEIVTISDLLMDKASNKAKAKPESCEKDGPTLFKRLFGNRPKIVPDQTDKQRAVPTPVQLTALPTQEHWVVDVMAGSENYQVRFESDAKGARQVQSSSVPRATARRPRLRARPTGSGSGTLSRLGLSSPSQPGGATASGGGAGVGIEAEPEEEEQSRDALETPRE